MVIELKPYVYRWEQDGWRLDVMLTPSPRWSLMTTGANVVQTEAQGRGLDLEDCRMRAQRVLASLVEGLP